jgi:hypothetical protein
MNPQTHQLELLPDPYTLKEARTWRELPAPDDHRPSLYPGQLVTLDGTDYEVRRITTERILLGAYGAVDLRKGQLTFIPTPHGPIACRVTHTTHVKAQLAVLPPQLLLSAIANALRLPADTLATQRQDSRNLRILSISAPLLERFMNGEKGLLEHDASNIPEDVEVVDLRMGGADVIEVVFYSATFDPVAEGEEIPVFVAELTHAEPAT